MEATLSRILRVNTVFQGATMIVLKLSLFMSLNADKLTFQAGYIQ